MTANRWTIVGLSALCLAGALALSVAARAQGSAAVKEQRSNKAAKVEVTAAGIERQVADRSAPAGRSYFVLETEWTNIHPKQKVSKDDLEGKQDRTMGVGGLVTGGKSEQKVEYVDADVAYLVPSFFDHAYLLADGASYALDPLTEKVAGGYGLKKEFVLPKQGDTKKVRLVFLVPEKAKNMAFQFFDYSYGHILVPLAGDLKLAAGAAGVAPKGLGSLKDEYLELAATAVDFRSAYQDEEAPAGWRYAVVKLNGRSLSKGNIVQVEPTEYVWLATKAGHLYYSVGGSTTDEGFIRFTPEFVQSQEVAFVVPAAEKDFSLGMRVENRIYALALSASPAAGPTAQPKAVHKDGRTLEIMLFGARREKGLIILDLGIRSLVESGAEIQADAQFILKAGGEDVSYDEEATAALVHRPPTPFTVPPRSFVRFELAYATEAAPAVALLPRLREREDVRSRRPEVIEGEGTMKKILVVLLAAAVVLAASACSKKNGEGSESPVPVEEPEAAGAGSAAEGAEAEPEAESRASLPADGEWQDAFKFVRDAIRTEPSRYPLKTPDGVEWGRSANPLEKALFLARLLQDKGMTVEIAEGELDDAVARSLLNEIFPAAKAVSVKSGTPLSNPSEDRNLVAAVKRHFWVRLEEGDGWIDLDPSFPSAEPGKAFAELADSFDPADEALGVKVSLYVRRRVGASGDPEPFLEWDGTLAEVANKPVSLTVMTEYRDAEAYFKLSLMAGEDSLADGEVAAGVGAETRLNLVAKFESLGEVVPGSGRVLFEPAAGGGDTPLFQRHALLITGDRIPSAAWKDDLESVSATDVAERGQGRSR